MVLEQVIAHMSMSCFRVASWSVPQRGDVPQGPVEPFLGDASPQFLTLTCEYDCLYRPHVSVLSCLQRSIFLTLKIDTTHTYTHDFGDHTACWFAPGIMNLVPRKWPGNNLPRQSVIRDEVMLGGFESKGIEESTLDWCID